MNVATWTERAISVEPAPAAPATQLALAVHLARVALVVLAALVLALSAQLLLLGKLEHRVDQIREFDRFRNELAAGTAPTESIDPQGHLLPLGTPIAMIQIPALGLEQVVDEGTTSAVLENGPGHLTSTAFPGQAGDSEIFGRAGAYGGPFRSIAHLRPGDTIVVTTQVGKTTYSVIDVRRKGSPIPALLSGQGRLTLVTAVEHWFVPSGVVYVDAVAPLLPLGLDASSYQVPASERPLGTDTSNLWELTFWIEGLVILAVMSVWSWRRWGRAQTWIVLTPAMAVVGFFVAGDATRLLPNLL